MADAQVASGPAPLALTAPGIRKNGGSASAFTDELALN